MIIRIWVESYNYSLCIMGKKNCESRGKIGNGRGRKEIQRKKEKIN